MIVQIFHTDRRGAGIIDTMPYEKAVKRIARIRSAADVRDVATHRLVGEVIPLAGGKFAWWIDRDGVEESDGE